MADAQRLEGLRLPRPNVALSRAMVREVGSCAGRALLAFWRDNCPGMAGMIAFFAFLSAVPLLILFLAFAGDFLGGRVSPHQVRQLFEGILPGLTEKEFLHTYWNPVRHSHVATRVIGVLSLLLGTTGLHDSIDWALNRIWRSHEGRPFWVGKLRGLAVIVWVVLFVVLSLGLTWLWANVLDVTHAPSGLVAALSALGPAMLLDVAIFTGLYMFTPTTRVWFRAALVGAVVASLLWELSKVLFGFWALQVGTYNRVYGPLAATVVVMLWMWISAMILLFGASLAFVLQSRRADHQPAPDGWWYDA